MNFNILKNKILNINQNNKEKGYCFFDIDGILNTSADWRIKTYSFRKDLVKRFCDYCKKNNYEPVMISSWRIGFYGENHEKNTPNIKELEEEFKKNELIIRYKTPELKGKSRDMEIERFLYYHPVERYIIIDDDKNEYQKITKHNYFIDSNIGFNWF